MMSERPQPLSNLRRCRKNKSIVLGAGKLDDGSGLEMIQTLRGEGYMFDVKVERHNGAGRSLT